MMMAESSNTTTLGTGPVDKSGDAKISGVTSRNLGTAMAPSGAIMEPDAARSVDPDHPAVDNNPRASTTVNQNRIDMNDPGLGERQRVADAMGIEQPEANAKKE